MTCVGLVLVLVTDVLKLPSKVNLVIPGPEQPLVDGVESYFRKGAFPRFLPTHPFVYATYM